MRPIYVDDVRGNLPCYSNEYCIYTPSKPDKHRVVTLMTSRRTCREYFCQDYRKLLKDRHYRGQLQTNSANAVIAEVSNNKEHMIQLHRNMLSGIHIAQLFEKYAGWKLTEYTKCKLVKSQRKYHKNTNIYYVRGSSRWNRGPHTLSLYLLLIRCGRILDARGITSLSALSKELKNIKRHHQGGNSDLTRIADNFDRYVKVMLGYHKLYYGLGDFRKVHGHFREDSQMEEGIDKLVYTQSYSREFNKRIQNILNKKLKLKEKEV